MLLVARMVKKHVRRRLRLHAEMHEEGRIAAVVEEHVRRAAIGPLENAMGVFPILGEKICP